MRLLLTWAKKSFSSQRNRQRKRQTAHQSQVQRKKKGQKKKSRKSANKLKVNYRLAMKTKKTNSMVINELHIRLSNFLNKNITFSQNCFKISIYGWNMIGKFEFICSVMTLAVLFSCVAYICSLAGDQPHKRYLTISIIRLPGISNVTIYSVIYRITL